MVHLIVLIFSSLVMGNHWRRLVIVIALRILLVIVGAAPVMSMGHMRAQVPELCYNRNLRSLPLPLQGP